MKNSSRRRRSLTAVLVVVCSLPGLASAQDVVFSPFDDTQFDELFPAPKVALVVQDEPTISVNSASTCSTEFPVPGSGPVARCSSGASSDDGHEVCSVDGADGSPDSCSTRMSNAGHCSAKAGELDRNFCSATGGSAADQEYVNCSTHIDGDNACSSQGEGANCSASSGANGEGICSAGSNGVPAGGVGGTAVCSAFTDGPSGSDAEGTCSAYAKGATCSVVAGMMNAGCSTFNPPAENAAGALSFADACSAFGLASQSSCSVIAPPPANGGIATVSLGAKCSVHNPPSGGGEVVCSSDESHNGPGQTICTSVPYCEGNPDPDDPEPGGGGSAVTIGSSVSRSLSVSAGNPDRATSGMTIFGATANPVGLTVSRWAPRVVSRPLR